MTYKIYYLPDQDSNNTRGYTLFDIEHNRVVDSKWDTWYSEIYCLPNVNGVAQYLKDSLNDDNFKFDEFLKDSEEIQEIRGLLYECYDNRPRCSEDSINFHYHVFRNVLEDKIYEFSKKYGLLVDID